MFPAVVYEKFSSCKDKQMNTLPPTQQEVTKNNNCRVVVYKNYSLLLTHLLSGN
jgi:hypothetical protein